VALPPNFTPGTMPYVVTFSCDPPRPLCTPITLQVVAPEGVAISIRPKK